MSVLYTDLPRIELHNWMKGIEGKRFVSELTIPGSHDSATGSSHRTMDPSSWVTTQSLTVAEQLRAGVRFLDIRAQLSRDELILMHSIAELGVTLWDVVMDCRDFLREYPSECILFSLKKEIADVKSINTFEQAFCAVFKKESSLWFLENNIPILDEVRGKLVLLRRFPLDSDTACLGIDSRFTDNEIFEYEFNPLLNQKFICQDHYFLDGGSYEEIITDKIAAVRKNISKIYVNKRHRNCLFMNLLSCVHPTQTPKSLSEVLNPLIISDYLADKRKLMGIFPCDYVGIEIARMLVMDNFDDHIFISSKASPAGVGFWILLRSGKIMHFGSAIALAGASYEDDIPVAFAITPTGLGCWILSRQGRIEANGDAGMFDSPAGDRCYVDIVSTPAGDGLLLLSSSGVIWVGDAKHFVTSFDSSGNSYNPRAFDISPSGGGCLVLTDLGVILNFGDSEHLGQNNVEHYKHSFVDIKMTPSGKGYWVLLMDGKICNFGDAECLDAFHLNGKVAVSFDRLADGRYYILTLDGRVNLYGNCKNALDSGLVLHVSIPAKL